MKIVESAAREHANSIIVLARRLFAPEDEFPVALHGGVATADMVAETLIRLVTREFPKADVRKPVYSPGLGLALFALHDLKRER
jgi:hypothetical protein